MNWILWDQFLHDTLLIESEYMWYMYMYLQSSVVKSNEGGGAAQPIIIEGMQAVQPYGNIVLLL